MRTLLVLSVAVMFVLSGISHSWGGYYGIVADLVGEVEYIPQGKKAGNNLLGANLSGGDELILGKGSILTVLSYEDDRELLIKGPVHVKIEADHILLVNGSGDNLDWLGEIVCYTPDEIAYIPDEIASRAAGGVAHRNGMVIRGVGKKISNTELISRVMSDVRDSMLALKKAHKYYEVLKERMPDSQFIESVEKYFEK